MSMMNLRSGDRVTRNTRRSHNVRSKGVRSAAIEGFNRVIRIWAHLNPILRSILHSMGRINTLGFKTNTQEIA